ncbi:hypothetical protein [Ancylobacter rudongensis]|uniref:hypothetical protein n=1 Tax=Ancylobacter rudongensis TaxID=177413 RepID=UPI000B81C3AA|nr:hypothetical protein [Ancylobacter rudongensis]
MAVTEAIPTEAMMDPAEAYELASTLVRQDRVELEGVDVISGYHREWGFVTIVIPSFGRSLVVKPLAGHDAFDHRETSSLLQSNMLSRID